MKTLLLLIFFLLIPFIPHAQNFELKIIGKNAVETKVIDSLGYSSKHKNTELINDEILQLSEKLSNLGFIDNSATNEKQLNDSTFLAEIYLGKRIKYVHIYIGTNKTIINSLSYPLIDGKIKIPYIKLDSFLNNTILKLEQEGYSLSKVQLTNVERQDYTLNADLLVEIDKKRNLNAIIVKYAESNRSDIFPKGHLKQINNKYRKSIFNQKTVENINSDFNKFSFVSQLKYPEILFTSDTTAVYVYLEKKNSNTFDGFLGFSNNDGKKISLTGYVDLTLENILKSGEQIAINWKSDGNDQKTFKGNIELPYLFKTPIGIKAEINIFRQDSTFQTTKTSVDLSYYLNYNSRFYLGYQTSTSSDIQNLTGTGISDFNNSFLTAKFEYLRHEISNSLFPTKTKLKSSLGIGQRELSTEFENRKNPQIILNIDFSHNFYLNKNNSIYLNSQNNYLSSNAYLINELFRFGGMNSIRGFSENSLQAYFLTALLTEYRYTLSTNLYIHSILDYSILKNKLPNENITITENLFGIGIGLGLQTKNGLFKFAAASGKDDKQEFDISNTIIHISYNVKF